MADSDKLGSPFDTSQPDRLADPREGDDRIRDVKQRLYNWATREHNVDGKHKVPVAATTPTPDATAYGQLAIKTGDGGYNELWCNVSGAFERLTSRGSVAALQVAVTVTLPAVDAVLQSQIDALEIDILDLDAAINALPKGGIKTQVYASGTTAFAPTGLGTTITKIYVEAWGGGGTGGAGSTYGAGGGGGCGAFARAYVDVTGISSISVTVGAAGQNTVLGTFLTCGGGVNGNNGAGSVGGNGGRCGALTKTSIATLINFVSYNGAAGLGGIGGITSTPASPGAGSGILQLDGGAGGDGTGAYDILGGVGAAGGGGGGGYGGGGGGGGYGGGSGGAAGVSGYAGSAYGAGGGGGGGYGGVTGGAGSAGYVIISY